MQIDISEIRKRLTEHKSFPYIVAAVRAVLIYMIYAFMTTAVQLFFLGYFQKNTEEFLQYPDAVLAILQTLILYLTMNTVLLSFAIHHRTEREAFKKECAKGEYIPAQERRRLLHSGVFWTEIAVLAVLFLLLPLYAFYSYPVRLLELLLRGHTIPTFFQNVLVFLCYAVGIFLLSVHTRMDARRLWAVLPGQLIRSKIWKSMRRKEQQSYSYLRLCLRLGGYFLIYILGTFAASYVIPIVISILRLGVTFSAEGWFWWLVGGIAVLIVFLALRKRVQMIRNLKKTCKKYGFRLFDARRMFLSLFYDGKRYTFGVEANGKVYYCRILASLKRSNKMILDDEGFCTRVFALHIPAPMMAHSGHYFYMADRGNGDDRVFFHFDSKVNYTFETEGDGEKILILNPVPKRAVKRIEGHLAEADNGDRIGDYQIFTGNAFLRHLMRESDAYDEKHT